MEYATTFSINPTDSGTWLSILEPWKGNTQPMHYYLYPRDAQPPSLPDSVRSIAVPIQRLVCYATTQLPYLDILDAEETLVAFPSTQYITTPSLKARADSGLIRDVGQADAVNPEVLLDLEPELVMMFAINEPGSEYGQLQKAGTPVVFNGDYLEQHPLGRVEYIKVFGALLDRAEAADSAFNEIKKRFLALENRAPAITESSPSVFGGVVYGDVWYAPGGDSWAADFIKRAGGRYLYADQPGTGSLQLSFESVYAQCLDADYWIGAGSYRNLSQMEQGEARYADFEAFQNGHVYSYMKGTEPNGGVPYLELGYARPDYILSDLMSIFHPQLAADTLFFYENLK